MINLNLIEPPLHHHKEGLIDSAGTWQLGLGAYGWGKHGYVKSVSRTLVVEDEMVTRCRSTWLTRPGLCAAIRGSMPCISTVAPRNLLSSARASRSSSLSPSTTSAHGHQPGQYSGHTQCLIKKTLTLVICLAHAREDVLYSSDTRLVTNKRLGGRGGRGSGTT